MLYTKKLTLFSASVKVWLLLIGSLTLFGLICIYSASAPLAIEQHGAAAYFVKRQLWAIMFGCIAAFFAYLVPVRLVQNLSWFWFVASLGLVFLTLFPAFSVRIHGSSRWLSLWGVVFQPSELLKMATIIFVAAFLDMRQYSRRSFWGTFFPLLCVLACAGGVLLLQPDFGLMLVLTITVFILLLLAQVRGEFLLFSCTLLVPVIALLIFFKPYRLRRILVFLNPWQDPRGAGFQVIQSLIAIGSGGWLGVGLAQSKQKFFYLPMQHTDFIFAIIAEEFGFVGALVLIGLYVLFLYTGICIALEVPSLYAQLVTLGFVLLVSLQALVNIGVTIGLLPTKGVGLPFVSYGGSHLFVHLAMLGIILRLRRDG